MDTNPVIVVVFMRGAVDGLNVVVPHGDPDYYALRPSIAIAPPTGGGGLPLPIPVPLIGGSGQTALDLDGYFGLHPSLAALLPLYQAGELAAVQATGAPLADRSHFSSQLRMEVAGSADSRASGGWLGRYLTATAAQRGQPVRAVSVGVALDQALAGAASAIAVPDSASFTLRTAQPEPWRSGLPPLHDIGMSFSQTQARVFSALDLFSVARPFEQMPENGATYPNDELGARLRQAAQYIKADIGIDAITLNSDGWDHHVSENTVLPPLLQSLGNGLAALRTDLGERFRKVVVVTMSEFGRTVSENASGGSDHGRANMMLVMGGGVAGGRVYGTWPTLAADRLEPGGDLAITTDYRTVLAEVLERHMGRFDPGQVFPGWSPAPALGLMR